MGVNEPLRDSVFSKAFIPGGRNYNAMLKAKNAGREIRTAADKVNIKAHFKEKAAHQKAYLAGQKAEPDLAVRAANRTKFGQDNLARAQAFHNRPGKMPNGWASGDYNGLN